VLDIYPILSLIKYLESKRYYWTIPVTGAVIFGVWLFNRSMSKKIEKERADMFNATIRTIQDILQNSTSSIQLLIMDMHDEGIREEIIAKAETNIKELKRVIQVLAAIDPSTIELEEINKNLSVIKMDK
jgi:hypothetical protein